MADEVKIDDEPLAPGGSLDARKDINLQKNLYDAEIARVLDGIFGEIGEVSISDLLSPQELGGAAIRLGNSMKARGTQVLGAVAIRGQRALNEIIDAGLIGNNTYHSFQKLEDVVNSEEPPRRPAGRQLGDGYDLSRRKVLNLVLGTTFNTDFESFGPQTDLNKDGHISEKEFKEFSKHNGHLEKYLETYNSYTPANTYEEKANFVQKDLSKTVEDGSLAHGSKIKKGIPQTKYVRTVDLNAMFEKTEGKKGLPLMIPALKASDRPPRRPKDGNLAAASFAEGIIPMGFEADGEDGAILTKVGEKPSDKVSDADAYVPLVFTDVRPHGGNNSWQRSIYFRPIITGLTEDLSPEWDKKTLYGRTDQVVTYMSTIRTIFLSFELHAFTREDVSTIQKKLNWLSSLVYPQYDNEMLLKSGPVCRMRVGDVISSRHKLGLPGVIDSLSTDYTDALWEISEGEKVPRSVKVSVSFHVLHDSIIGKTPGGFFGGIGEVDSAGRYSATKNSSFRGWRGTGDIDSGLEKKFDKFTDKKENK